MNPQELLTKINDNVASIVNEKVQTITEKLENDFKVKREEYEKELSALKAVKSENKAHNIEVHDRSDDDPVSGFSKGLGEFAQAVYRAGMPGGVVDKRLVDMRKKAAGSGLVEGTGSDGGFLIPVQYRTDLMQSAIEKANLMSRCQAIPMQTNSIKIPYINDTTHASTVFGGIRMYWEEELAEKTSSKPSIGQVNLILHKVIGLCYASDEILEDSPVTIDPLIKRMFSDALAWTIDDVIINGKGGGQPLGILNAPALISVAIETNQLADTINYDNVVKMYMRMSGTGRQNAIWLANSDCIHQLMTMSLAVGTGGSAVFLPAGGASTRPYDTLFGKPIIFTEHCQTVGDNGDIYFVDLSQYLVGRKTGAAGNLKMDTSIHLKFDYDQTAFRFVFRMDGQPWVSSELTPHYGSTTTSPFVALAERA